MNQFDETRTLRDDKGRFAGSLPSAESGIDLAVEVASRPFDSTDNDANKNVWRDARAAALSRASFVPATSTTTSIDLKVAGSEKQLGMWWANQSVVAEYDHERGDYLQMPDDYTPGGHGGRSIDGIRRTHRMNYSGSGVELRMPSATAARRFAAEHGGKTFDMPVQTRLGDGRSVQGWVRCTPGPNGRWDTESVGFDEREADTVAEAVNAVLEARRVRTALRDAGDLRARREQRLAERGIVHKPVDSSWIQSAGYQDATDADTGLMVMTTKPYMTKGLTRKDGTVVREPQARPSRQYGYEVSREVFDKFINSDKPGATFNELIKGRHDRFELTECPNCQKFHRTSQPHTCGATAQPRQFDPEAKVERSKQRLAAASALPERNRSPLARLFGARRPKPDANQ